MGVHDVRLVLGLGVILWCGVVINAAQVFGPADVEAVVALVSKDGGGKTGFGKSLPETFYAVATLWELGEVNQVDKEGACSLASESLTKGRMNMQNSFFAAETTKLLGCLVSTPSPSVEASAIKALSKDDSLLNLYYAAATLSALKATGVLSAAVPKDAVSALLATFQSLRTPSGRLRPRRGAASSVGATGLAFLTLERLRDLSLELSETEETGVDEIIATAPRILATADGNGLSTVGDTDKLQAASFFVRGLAAVHAADVDVIKLHQVATYLARLKHVGTAEDAFHLVSGLHVLASSTLPHPLFIAPTTSTISASGSGAWEVVVRNAVGQAVEGVNVTLVSSPSATPKSKASLSPEPLTLLALATPGAYAAQLPLDGLELGSYRVVLVAGAEASPGTVAGSLDADVVVTDVLRVEEVIVELQASNGPVLSSDSLLLPGGKLESQLRLDDSSQLKVSLVVKGSTSGKPFTPQQVFLQLTSKTSVASAYVSAKPAKKTTTGALTLTATSASIEKQIGPQGGVFEVSLLVGDACGENRSAFVLGSLEVVKAPSEGPSASQAGKALFEPRPVINHIFRQPEKRPPAALSYAFTGLALAPLAVLAYLLIELKANLKGFPRGGTHLMSALAFHAGIASILGLFAWFWLALNLIETLTLLLPLGLFTSMAGYFNLSALADARLGLQAVADSKTLKIQ